MASKGLFVVMDATGRQWLCPSRPILIGAYPGRHWEVKAPGLNDSVRVSRESGCIPLSSCTGLDRSSFEGKLAWRVYGVGISLE